MGFTSSPNAAAPSTADSLCSRAHSLAQRASDTAADLNSKLAPYSFPEPNAVAVKDSPVESLPDYFHGLRCPLDNIEIALNQIASANNRAQL